jgi:hypothetical protein
MASLALIVSLIFLFVLFIGPITYLLSYSRYIPNIIIYLLGIACVLIGLWWLFLPIPMIKYYGLIDMFFGYKAISQRSEK